jgi:hypothetical protein
MPMKWTPWFLISVGVVDLLFMNRSPNIAMLGFLFIAWGGGLLLFNALRPKPPVVKRTILTTVIPSAIPPVQGGRVASVSDELAKLGILRDRGVITADEFEAQKRKLLA